MGRRDGGETALKSPRSRGWSRGLRPPGHRRRSHLAEPSRERPLQAKFAHGPWSRCEQRACHRQWARDEAKRVRARRHFCVTRLRVSPPLQRPGDIDRRRAIAHEGGESFAMDLTAKSRTMRLSASSWAREGRRHRQSRRHGSCNVAMRCQTPKTWLRDRAPRRTWKRTPRTRSSCSKTVMPAWYLARTSRPHGIGKATSSRRATAVIRVERSRRHSTWRMGALPARPVITGSRASPLERWPR